LAHGGEARRHVERAAAVGLDGGEELRVPGVRAADRARHGASRRVAGRRDPGGGRRPRRPPALAHALLEDPLMSIEIRAGVELPARREDVELRTDDGLTLVGELSLPLERDPVATLV